MARNASRVKAKPAARQTGSRRRRRERRPAAQSDFLVVGIGASAGGIEALKAFFEAMPASRDMAFVVIQHLDPSHVSTLPELLAQHTPMTVVAAENGAAVEPGTVSVIPPGRFLSIAEGRLKTARPRTGLVRLPIDLFLRSLADAFEDRAVAVILSGTGTDGSLGIRSIKEKGGLVLVEDPEEAPYDGMPRSAMATGAVDMVLTAADMPAALDRFRDRQAIWAPGTIPAAEKRIEDILPDVIDILKATQSHDFTPYKPSMLLRRIVRRMALNHVGAPAEFVELLRSNAEEREALFKDLLINVTGFFRGQEAFAHLEKHVIPDLVEAHTGDRPMRVWVPGCSTGEEAYSIAMLLIEALTAAGKDARLQVFATDVDVDALETARNAAYPESIESDVSPQRLQRFFTRNEHSYVVRPQLRESIIVAAQNLLTDAPFSNLDLISCRNLLIYLRQEVQDKVLRLLHYALRSDGVLFLGPSETVAGEREHFEAISRKHRIFKRVGHRHVVGLEVPIAGREPLFLHAAAGRAAVRKTIPNLHELSERALIEAYAPASVLVDSQGDALFFIGAVDRYLRIPSGEAAHDIVPMAREGLRAKLRTALEQARGSDGLASVAGAYVKRNGGSAGVTIAVRPIAVEGDRLLLVSFLDVPEPVAQGPQVGPPATADGITVARLEQELESTRTELQGMIRDLEISNEELRAANEEAMSINEEFQSTNEELETSKEELQSLNEELTTVNTELQEKVEQQRRSADDLRNLLDSSDIATLFLDRELKIRFFTPAVRKLFNIIDTDVGRPLGDLTQKLRDPSLLDEASAVLSDLSPIQREVQGNEGQWFNRSILPYRTVDERIEGVVITFVDISEVKHAQTLAQAAQAFQESIVDTVPTPLLVLDEGLKVVAASRSLYRAFLLAPRDVVGWHLSEAGHGEFNVPALIDSLERILPERTTFENLETELLIPALGRRLFNLNAREISPDDEPERLILMAMEDVTERRHAVDELFADLLEAGVDAMLLVDERGTIRDINARVEPLFGHPRDAVVGRPVEMLIPERARATHRDHVRHFFADPRPRIMGQDRGVEILGLAKDGTQIPLQVGLSMVRGRDGPLAVAAIRDMTAQKRAERSLEEAKRAAERANEAKSQLLAAAGRDLRQPIQTLGILAGILSRTVTQRDSREVVSRLGLAIDTMTDAVNSLLDIDQLDGGLVEPSVTDFAIGPSLERMRTEFEQVARTKRLDLRVVPSTLVARSDRQLLDRILQNLVSNALKYTNSGKVLIGCRRRGRAVRIEVWDTGIGIPEDRREAIFDRYVRGVRGETGAAEGSGLGLYVVRRMAALLGHSVAVSSTAGKGSVFSIELPLSDAAAQSSSSQPLPRGRRRDGEPTVLLVALSPQTRRSLSMLLELEGYVVHSAEGHREAHKLVSGGGFQSSAMIVDDDTANGVGLQDEVRLLREGLGTQTPAIVLTHDASPARLEALVAQGCTPLVKPVKAQDLLAYLRRIFMEAGNVRRPARARGVRRRAGLVPVGDGRPRILLVSSDAKERTGIEGYLTQTGHRVQSYASGRQFLEAFNRSATGCLLLDLGLRDVDAVELIERLKSEGSVLPVVLLVGRRNAARAVGGIQAGAVAVLEKPLDYARLLEAVEAAVERGRSVAAEAHVKAEARRRLGRLTPRERQVLSLLVAGHANKEIAARLGISLRTAENHRLRIRAKVATRSLAELIDLVRLVEGQ